MKWSSGFSAGLAIACFSTSVFAQEDGADRGANWDAIAACATLRTPERHACMDAVLRAAGLLDRPREIAEQRESFGQPEQPAEVAPQPVLPPQLAEAPEPPPQMNRLLTTIQQAIIGNDRRLIFRTQEGAVWKQTDGPTMRRAPEADTPLSIEEAALGSFRCRYGSTIFRCERVD